MTSGGSSVKCDARSRRSFFGTCTFLRVVGGGFKAENFLLCYRVRARVENSGAALEQSICVNVPGSICERAVRKSSTTLIRDLFGRKKKKYESHWRRHKIGTKSSTSNEVKQELRLATRSA